MTEGISIQDLAAQLEQGVDLYAVIGQLYVSKLARDAALSVAVQALEAAKAALPKEEPPAEAPTIAPDPIPQPSVPTVAVETLTEEGA
jgi:hypothetical protein